MKVIRKMQFNEFENFLGNSNSTSHIFDKLYRTCGIGGGRPCAGFLVDKNHPNGLEEHIIFSNALMVVRNHNTKKIVTVFAARPAQIKRYYDALGFVAPSQIVNLARKHQQMGFNWY